MARVRLAPLALCPDVHLVRVLVGIGPAYDRMIVVKEHSGGRVLHLAGWIGKPLTPSEWRAARDKHFPGAREIHWERRCPKTGVKRLVMLQLAEPGQRGKTNG